MSPRRRNSFLICFAVLSVGFFTNGCASQSKARLKEQNAYLAGQNAALRRELQAAGQTSGVTIDGPVQNPLVPWVDGLTLAQAIATADYIGPDSPKQIIITRHGETATLDAKVLLDGTDVPLKKGDVIELR
jgi:hypothetical protein